MRSATCWLDAEDVRLLEQAVHQRRFAMVYVRNDGDVAQIGSFYKHGYCVSFSRS